MILFPIVLAVGAVTGWYAYERQTTGNAPLPPLAFWIAVAVLGAFLAWWWWAILSVGAVLVVVAWGAGSVLARRRQGHSRALPE